MKTAPRRKRTTFLEGSTYLDENQLAYFKNKLIYQKIQLMEKMTRTKQRIKRLQGSSSDIIDRSNSMLELEHEIRSHGRHTALFRQIEAALERIDNGSFGYCQMTGNRIGIRRLEVLPFTTLCIQALEQAEIGSCQ